MDNIDIEVGSNTHEELMSSYNGDPSVVTGWLAVLENVDINAPESRREQRKREQLEEIQRIAKAKGISEEQVKKMLRDEKIRKAGDTVKTIASVLNQIQDYRGGATTSYRDDYMKRPSIDDDEGLRILGMKPWVAGLVGLAAVGAVVGTIYLVRKGKAKA